jgi:hypothetical protein
LELNLVDQIPLVAAAQSISKFRQLQEVVARFHLIETATIVLMCEVRFAKPCQIRVLAFEEFASAKSMLLAIDRLFKGTFSKCCARGHTAHHCINFVRWPFISPS